MVLDVWMSVNCFQWRKSGPELHLGWRKKSVTLNPELPLKQRQFPQSFPLGTMLFSFVVSHPNYCFLVVTGLKGIDERGCRARVVWLGKQRIVVSCEYASSSNSDALQ
jgi:hypothetical protein